LAAVVRAVVETMQRQRLTVAKAGKRWRVSTDTIGRMRKRGFAIPPLRHPADGAVFLEELARAFHSRNGKR
jgi:hypothetical protein